MDERPAMKRHDQCADRRKHTNAGGGERPGKPDDSPRGEQRPDQALRPEPPAKKSRNENRRPGGEIRRCCLSRRTGKREQFGADRKERCRRPDEAARPAHPDQAHERREGRRRQFPLRHESPRRRIRQPACGRRKRLGSRSGRRPAATPPAKPSRHLEAVEVGELNVEQDESRQQRRRCDHGRARRPLPHRRPRSLRRARSARGRPEAGMVVDDQHGARHTRIVAELERRAHRGEPYGSILLQTDHCVPKRHV